MSTPNSVTIKQIAEKSGYSLRTVCRVLNDKDVSHRTKTREKILRVAAELNYMPNATAKAMRSGRFGGVSLLLSSDRHLSHIPIRLLEGIQAALNPSDLHLTVACMADRELTSEAKLPKILRQLMSDGILVNYSHRFPPEMDQIIDAHQMPSIWINRRKEHDCVYVDDLTSAHQATEYLLKLGHRRIAYLDYHNDATASSLHYSVHDRRHGYELAMNEAGLWPIVITRQGVLNPEDRVPLAAEMLGRSERPTAFLTYSPWTAIPLWLAATTRHGLSIPRDLSIITFSDVFDYEMGIALTTMLLPELEVGLAATQMLLERINRPSHHFDPQSLPATLFEGSTVAPPASGSEALNKA